MHSVVGILFRCLGWMFGAGMGGCTLALVMGLAEEIKLTVAEHTAHRRPGRRRYGCFLLAVDFGGLNHAMTRNRI